MLGNLGATETIDMAGESWVWVEATLDANCAITTSNVTPGDRLTLFLVQDATGSRTLSVDGSPLGIASAANAPVQVDLAYTTANTWVDVAGGGGIQETVVNAKGDLLVATADNTVTRLAVGTNDHVLTADSAQGTGVKWAAAGAASGPTLIRKTADQAITSSNTVLEDVTGLVLPVLANETWEIKLVLLLTSNNATGDWKFGWAVPASTTMFWGARGGTVATLQAWRPQAVATAAEALLIASDTTAFGSQNVTHGAIVEGIVRVAGTAGNVQLQVAQNTSSVDVQSVLEDSLIIANRIATS